MRCIFDLIQQGGSHILSLPCGQLICMCSCSLSNFDVVRILSLKGLPKGKKVASVSWAVSLLDLNYAQKNYRVFSLGVEGLFVIMYELKTGW